MGAFVAGLAATGGTRCVGAWTAAGLGVAERV
jgi:hypothetical protein